jgi:LuxR family transcriptional regulator, maltose regulon positive regulatory protein
MPEVLIQSKITTPQLNDKIVHRERLIKLLDENVNKNFIIIYAPAGFGKTTLVLDYLSANSQKHAWFSIPHKGIEDASTFFEYLISSVQNINHEFGTETLEVMKQFTQSPKMSKELVSGFTASFVNEFQKHFKDNVILVIEDLHYINTEKSEKWLREFFTELQENIPPNLHLILSTRVLPEMELTGLKAKRNVFIIGENDLSFNEEETTILLKDVYKINYDKNDIKLLDENIKGWITGLHLLLQAYGEDFNKVEYKGRIDANIIFDFFAQEIFDNLSPELQEFMMVTSLIESFDEDLSNAVLGTNNSKQLIEKLIRKNLFIHQVHKFEKNKKNGNMSYGYHALFRDFLNRRLQSSKIAQEIKKLMEKIGDSYVSSGDEIAAVNYFLEAENYDKAVPLIIKNNEVLYDSGKYDILWTWYNTIPENIINGNTILLFKIGYLYMYTSTNYQSALNYLEKVEELSLMNNNPDNLAICCEVISQILINTGKLDQAKSKVEKLLKYKLKPENVVRLLNCLADIYLECKNYEEALRLLEKAREYCNIHELVENYDKIYFNLARVQYEICEYDKAILYYRKSLSYEKTLYNIIMTYCNMAILYIDISDYTKALKYFNKVFKLMENSYSRELYVHVSCQEAYFLQVIGDLKESTKILENTLPVAESNNVLLYLNDITDYLFMNYFLLDDYDNSYKYLLLNKKYTELLNLGYYKKIHMLREAIFSVKYDLSKSAEEILLNTHNYFNSISNIILITQTEKYLSNYYLLNNDIQSAVENLTKFLNETNFETNDLINLRNLIDFALSRPELTQNKDKVHHAFTQFFDRLNIEGTSDEYKRKMKIEIDNLYDIRMTAFRNLEFVSRGVPVLETKWRKKKGKSILAYMMLNPKARYNKDKLIEMFFPDSKPDTVEDSFRQGLFNIRNAFKNPYISFLIQESKNIYLNPDCYFKSDAEEFNKLCGIARSAERSSEEKLRACIDAVELYKGEFMEDNYEPWCEDLRADFHNKFISISELLLDLLSKEKNYEEIIHYSEKLLKHDKLNEKAYHSLVEAYVSSERRKSAKEIYTKMLRIYEEELSEKPDVKILKKIQFLLGI